VDAPSPKDLHYYEPVNGHGLSTILSCHHRPAPDRLDLVAGRQGQCQSRALQLFHGFNYTLRSSAFSSTSWKDSVVNIQETGEFVWNLATMDLAKADERHRGAMSPTTWTSSPSPG